MSYSDQYEPPAITRAFVDEVAPEHGRTSCHSDDGDTGNEYFNEMGYPRCVRCCLLFRVRMGRWPHGATFRIGSLVAVDNFRKEDI